MRLHKEQLNGKRRPPTIGGFFGRNLATVRTERRDESLRHHTSQPGSAPPPVDDEYRKGLLLLIDTYNGQIISRPYYAANEGWDGLKALKSFTLSNQNEGALRALFAGNSSFDAKRVRTRKITR